MSVNKYAWEKVVRDAEDLSSKDKLVAFIMGTYANKDGWNVMVSQQTMSRQVGGSLSTIERAVRKLLATGYIEQTRRAVNRGPNPGPAAYRLTVPLQLWKPVPAGTEIGRAPFYPSKVDPSPMTAETPVDNLLDPSPMTAETEVHPSPMTAENEWFEDSPVISDGLTRHFDSIDPSNEVVSPVTHDGLTVFNKSSTEEEEHSGTTVPGPTPIPARTRTAIQSPLMTIAASPERRLPTGQQPRLFLEAKLGRELDDDEDFLAASLDFKGRSREAILSALHSHRKAQTA